MFISLQDQLRKVELENGKLKEEIQKLKLIKGDPSKPSAAADADDAKASKAILRTSIKSKLAVLQGEVLSSLSFRLVMPVVVFPRTLLMLLVNQHVTVCHFLSFSF